MFDRESEMATATTNWMSAGGLLVKAEFVTPWGICDLAGVSFNRNRLARRVRQRQVKALTSVARTSLLLRIPDVGTRRSICLKDIANDWAPLIPVDAVAHEVERLITDGFVVRTTRGRLQKINGWMPLQRRVVAVELKLSRIEDAMRQARSNLGFAEESYVALPTELARRVSNNRERWEHFFRSGIGLLGVGDRDCDVLVTATKTTHFLDQAVQAYCVEKFWAARARDN